MKEKCQKIAYANYLECEFFPEPKAALGKDPL